MLKISAEEKQALKGRGIILNRDQEHFSIRVITGNSMLSADELSLVAEAARRFGDGNVALTVRMTLEIQNVPYENIEPTCELLATKGLYTGGTGRKVRPVVPCKGTVCTHGLIDTQALADEIHEKFYLGWHDVTLPHKFKIGIGGCPNNCIKPGLNDFGIMGQRVPKYDMDKCRGCGKCNVEAKCPMKICTKGEDGKMVYQTDLCTNCGKCIDACPFGAIEEAAVGYGIMIGGIWGKHQRMATRLDGVYTKEQLFEILEKTMTLWKEQGESGERFGLFLDRVGVENFIAQLVSEIQK